MSRYHIILATDLDKDIFFTEIRDKRGCLGEMYEEQDELVIDIAAYGRDCIQEPFEDFKDALLKAKERLFRNCTEEEINKSIKKKKYSILILSVPHSQSLKAEILDDNQTVASIIKQDNSWMLEMYCPEASYESFILFNYYGFMEALEQAKQKLFFDYPTNK